MADAQSYHDGLVAQGYPADQALAYTRQYYPDFTPAAAAPVAAAPAAPQPVQPAAMAPAAAQPMAAQAMPQAVAAQPMPAQAMPQPMMAQPSMAAEGPSMMGWAAVGLIAMALLLSVVAQFNGAWLSGEQEDGTQVKTGLHSITFDCSEIADEANTRSITNLFVALLSWKTNTEAEVWRSGRAEEELR